MLANHKGEIPFFLLLLPFITGIGLGLYLLAGANLTWLMAAFSALSLVFIFLNLTYTRIKLYKNSWIGGSIITLILFLAGWIAVIRYNELNDSNHFSKKSAQFLLVKVNNEPNLKNGLLRFTANVEENINNNKASIVSGSLLIAIRDSLATNLYYGDELLIPAKYNAIDPPFNPAEFNYKQYLANQNIHYQAFLFPKQYKVISTNAGNPVIAYSLQLRRHLVEKLKLNMHDTSAIAVASTLILGYKTDLSNDILQAYSKTGTVHVLSVSGAHVAIIYGLLALMLSFLDRYRYGKIIKAIIIVSFIWYYSLLTGFSPAVCRAAVMISMVIIGKTFTRYINTLNILAISAFGLLLYDPFFITDVGFQLSYLAVFGLIVFQPIVYKWFSFKNKWADRLWAICSVSIAAQVITFPLSAFYFHQFPVYFLFSNLFIIIPTAIIMYAGGLLLLLPQMPIVTKACAYVLEYTILIMNKVLALIEHAPYASVSKIWLTTAEYLLLYGIIITLFYFLYDKKKWLIKTALVCLLLFCASIGFKRIRSANTNSIAFLSLRKHQGIVFKNGNRAILLSDILPDDKTYKYSVQPYLDSCKVSEVELYGLNHDISSSYLFKKYNFVQFLNKRVLLVNKQTPNLITSPKIKTDFIYLTGNPNAGITEINNSFDYNMLIVDGSNFTPFIERIESEAVSKRVNYKILKRNKSYVSVSN